MALGKRCFFGHDLLGVTVEQIPNRSRVVLEFQPVSPRLIGFYIRSA
jgi:hypothetical protein